MWLPCMGPMNKGSIVEAVLHCSDLTITKNCYINHLLYFTTTSTLEIFNDSALYKCSLNNNNNNTNNNNDKSVICYSHHPTLIRSQVYSQENVARQRPPASGPCRVEITCRRCRALLVGCMSPCLHRPTELLVNK